MAAAADKWAVAEAAAATASVDAVVEGMAEGEAEAAEVETGVTVTVGEATAEG